ncbi:S24 family peptidase [Escherichia coli]
MGFPSPATDYQENRLSLDQHCNTGAPGVFFFRSDTYSFREGIKPGALLIVDFGGTPVDGSLVLCVLEQEFRIMRLRLHPKRGTVAKLAMRQPFVLFKGLTFQKLCLPGAFRPGDHHNKMLRPGLCVVHASPQYL